MEMPDKDLTPRGNDNARRTRGDVHGENHVRLSARPTASYGVSNKTYDTPSDAAGQAAFKNVNSNKSVGPPLSRGVLKLKT